MQYDSPHYDAVWFNFDLIQCDSMQYDAMEKNMIGFYFFGSDRQQILN